MMLSFDAPSQRLRVYIRHIFKTAGLQNGASHCAQILSAIYAALDSDPSDPDVIIKLDMSNTFNALCRQLTPVSRDRGGIG